MFPTHDPATDVLLPLPEPGESWDPHTVYNYANLFHVPEAGISVFGYVKCKPAFPLVEGGICIFRGLDNYYPQDMEYCDYQMTMPWPGVDDDKVALANGYTVDVVERGQEMRLTYRSPDGQTSVDVTSSGLTPLLARGHIIPGEENQEGAAGQLKGGSEQMMHNVGEIVVNGERFEVDSKDGRDRSWGQVRTEFRDGRISPPALWTPMWFDDLAFNQVGYEAPDTDPSWRGVFDIPEDRPSHYFAWVIVDGEAREVESVHMDVHERHPVLHMPTSLEIEATDAQGDAYHFTGEAVAMTALPTWPNSTLRQALYRWEDDDGRVAFNSSQEMWWDQAYQRAMNARSTGRAAIAAS